MCNYRDKEWLAHQYEDLDKTISEIADLCNTSEGTISPYMQAYGLTNTISNEEMEKYNDRTWLIRELVIRGKGSKKLHKETGIYRKVFGIWKRENDVETNAQKVIGGRKLCSKCGDWKPLEEFNRKSNRPSGRASQCRLCERESRKTQEARQRKRKYQKKFRKENPEYGVHHAIGAGIWESLKDDKSRKGWEEILPYSFEDLKEHLQEKFKDGMSFDNYGDWHIDHVKPRSSFDIDGIDDPDLQKCWALENLQPLWAEENLRKNAKSMEKYREEKAS